MPRPRTASPGSQDPTLPETLALLRAVELLHALNDSEIEAMARETAWRRVRKGEEVLAHLSTSEGVFFIAEGSFVLTMTPTFGRSLAIRRLSPGDHFGEIAALLATPRSVAVRAESVGLLGECPGPAFRAAMEANGAFASAVAAALARTVVSLTDRLFELAALEMRFRLYAELLRLAQSGEVTGEGIRIARAPTHAALAAAIGAKRESVTRELNYLAGEGVIAQDKREILIRDVERLALMIRKRAGPTVSQLRDWRA